MNSTGTTPPEQKGLSHPMPALPSLVHRCRPSRCRSAARRSTALCGRSRRRSLVFTTCHASNTPEESRLIVGLLTCLRIHQTFSDLVVNAELPLNSTVLTTRLSTWSSNRCITLRYWHIIRMTLIHPCHSVLASCRLRQMLRDLSGLIGLRRITM